MGARGRPSGIWADKIWRQAVHRAVKRKLDGEGKPLALERLADTLVQEALAGDISALKEIGDRLDGRPGQQGPGETSDNPLHVKHEITVVTGVPRAGRDD